MTAATRRALFVRRMVAWLNAGVVPEGTRVDPDTPLFERGLIDSLAIMELIAWTEMEVGQEIPDPMIRMDNFHTVSRIAEVFLPEDGRAG